MSAVGPHIIGGATEVPAQPGSTASETAGFQFDDRKHKVEVITSYSHKDCDLLDDRTQQAGDKSKVNLQSENDILIYSLGGLMDFQTKTVYCLFD